jgi:hypothetical protein
LERTLAFFGKHLSWRAAVAVQAGGINAICLNASVLVRLRV